MAARFWDSGDLRWGLVGGLGGALLLKATASDLTSLDYVGAAVEAVIAVMLAVGVIRVGSVLLLIAALVGLAFTLTDAAPPCNCLGAELDASPMVRQLILSVAGLLALAVYRSTVTSRATSEIGVEHSR